MKEDWSSALEAYESARKAFLLLFGQGLNEVEARDLIEQTGSLFPESAFASAEMGDLEGALDSLIEGKAKQVAVALRQQIEVPAEKGARFVALKSEIRDLSRIAEEAQGNEGTQALQKLEALRQELGSLLEEGRFSVCRQSISDSWLGNSRECLAHLV